MGKMIESNATDEAEGKETSVSSVASVSHPLGNQPMKSSPQIVGVTPLQTDGREFYESTNGNVNREELADSTPDNNYKMICRECVIRDVAESGCNHCGIYHYVARLKKFRVNVKGGN